ncbi:nuclear transport factor 2 family protein [Streptosporangium sp. NPDC000396]|uniref:nuclear transport factor 2 family protein n=1 Tax=Streptosporangium sp. NPDC000396 TaxID=3366185 RepID=UPI0036A18538
MNDLNDFARRYIAVWNEPDADLRLKAITELFAPDAAHYTPSQEVHGHAELEVRITTAYEKWVRPEVYVFRAVPNANGHHNTVRFNWEMVTQASGEVDSVGFDFIVLNEEGLIKSDHQFIDG